MPVNTIGVATQKGGPGKTTMNINIAAALAWSGYRVAVADLDVQADATISLGVQPADVKTVGHLITGEVSNVQDILIDRSELLEGLPGRVSGGALYLIPSEDRALRRAIYELSGDRLGGISAVPRVIAQLDGIVDWAAIDYRPDLDVLVGSCMAATRGLIAAIWPKLATLRGAVALRSSMDTLVGDLHTATAFLGTVINMYEDGEEASWVEAELDENPQMEPFETRIPVSKLISKAYAFGSPAVLQYPASSAADSFVNLAAEVVDRYQKVAA